MGLQSMTNINKAKLRKFLDSFDTILCDCGGVLWNEREVFGGVKETLKVLSSLGKSIKFVTNNTIHSLENLHRKVSVVHDVRLQDIISPTQAMIEHLKEKGMTKKVFLIGSTQMKQEFVNAGFDVVKQSHTEVEENYIGIVTILNESNDDVGVVISDCDLNMSYRDLILAGLHLQKPDVIFMSGPTEEDILFKGKMIVGPGYFKNMLEDLTGRKSLSFGKPNGMLNDYLKRRFGIEDPSRTLFVGDSLEQDMRFASRYGYKKLLVLTGRTKEEDLSENTAPEYSPDFYIPKLGDLHKLIASHRL